MSLLSMTGKKIESWGSGDKSDHENKTQSDSEIKSGATEEA